jgi:hypothetical protein
MIWKHKWAISLTTLAMLAAAGVGYVDDVVLGPLGMLLTAPIAAMLGLAGGIGGHMLDNP